MNDERKMGKHLPLEFKRMHWEFESKSEPGTMHLVTVDPKTGELACGCKAYYFHHDCWHVRRVHSQRLMASKGFELQEAETPEVRLASLYHYVLLVPKINLGEENTVPRLATAIYDMLNLGVTMAEIRNWFTFLPETWTEIRIIEYIEENGRTLGPQEDNNG